MENGTNPRREDRLSMYEQAGIVPLKSKEIISQFQRRFLHFLEHLFETIPLKSSARAIRQNTHWSSRNRLPRMPDRSLLSPVDR